MTRFAIYERVQGSEVRTWRVDAENRDAAARIAHKVLGAGPLYIETMSAPATKQPKKKRKGKG